MGKTIGFFAFALGMCAFSPVNAATVVCGPNHDMIVVCTCNAGYAATCANDPWAWCTSNPLEPHNAAGQNCRNAAGGILIVRDLVGGDLPVNPRSRAATRAAGARADRPASVKP